MQFIDTDEFKKKLMLTSAIQGENAITSGQRKKRTIVESKSRTTKLYISTTVKCQINYQLTRHY